MQFIFESGNLIIWASFFGVEISKVNLHNLSSVCHWWLGCPFLQIFLLVIQGFVEYTSLALKIDALSNRPRNTRQKSITFRMAFCS
jgi:hypothetical protein